MDEKRFDESTDLEYPGTKDPAQRAKPLNDDRCQSAAKDEAEHPFVIDNAASRDYHTAYQQE